MTPVFAQTQLNKEAMRAQKMKAGIAKLGVGPESRVKIKLRDKSVIEGYISKVEEDFFAVMDTKTGLATTIAYPQLKQVTGHNFSTGAKIGIGVAIAIGVAVIVALATRGDNSRDSGVIRCGGITTPCP
jgi:hypothetical protein